MRANKDEKGRRKKIKGDEKEEIARLGVLSDTHGLLRPFVKDALRSVNGILHAGDIGGKQVFDSLGRIAPLTAVRGNMDRGEWARDLPRSQVVQVGDLLLYMIHDFNSMDLDPAAAGFAAVISGHSHRPASRRANGVLYLNPGSAGPRRFSLPITFAILTIKGKSVGVEWISPDKL